MQFHPLADLFPLMGGAEFEALVADIREHGLREPVVLHEGKILDGRNRFRACSEAGVTPVFEDWDQDGTAQAYVVSKNLHRRHLNESQRAMIAAKLANAPSGLRTDLGQIEPRSELTNQEAAELLNVSRSSVVSAKKVLAEGTPEEVDAVLKGEAAARPIADQIRAKMPVDKRKKKRAEPMSQVGKNPERIQRQRINAEVWGRVRDALTHLTSLPLPADVVAIVRAHDKTGFVEVRMAKALQYLKELEHEWSHRDEAAA